MNRVSIELEHCYGIKKLKTQVEFTKSRVCAIYAQNGVMKTSLAETFKSLSKGMQPVDRIFPTHATVCKIKDENGADLPNDSLLVVKSYDEESSNTDRASTLLVDATLKKEYDQLHIDLDSAKEKLVAAIKAQAKSKKDIQAELSFAFTRRTNDFDTALMRISKELENQTDAPFADIEYDTVFDEKVIPVISKSEIKDALQDYMKRYNLLLAASVYFKKGTFDYYNAGKIAKALADNGFFDASHSVNLNAASKNETIKSQKQLEKVISDEKDTIIKDQQLKSAFNKIAKELEKNESMRDFQSYMLEHEDLASELSDLDTFREKVFKSYIKENYSVYLEWFSKREATEKREKQIKEEALKQTTQWSEVIRIFNERFYVPFRLVINNQAEVTLGTGGIDLGFVYKDGADEAHIDKLSLLRSLSQGEKKAFYILHVLFEIRRRKLANQETLLVVDDIADSFDYQNKYAIVHYLREVSQDPLFKQIIMTHNFDFFRTLNSRFVPRDQCYVASKGVAEITLKKAGGEIRNVFVKEWKPNFYADPEKKIASICFLRNIIEYTEGSKNAKFKKLTSLLHWKQDTPTITVAELDGIYNDVCNTTGASTDPTALVVDLIRTSAQAIVAQSDGSSLESKVVLSLATRIAAEKFMVDKIADPGFCAAIKINQTPVLLDRFKTQFPGETKSIETLDLVSLMTPEHIHLNSFMYEPLIDMSPEHLQNLYKTVVSLK